MIFAFSISFIAGLLIGILVSKLSALKDFQFFNTWLILFVFVLILFPTLVSFLLLKDFKGILTELPFRTFKAITIPSLFGGVGLFLLANAIRKTTAGTALFLFSTSLALGLTLKSFLFGYSEITLVVVGIISIFLFVKKLQLSLSSALLPIFGGLASIGFAVAYRVEPETITGLAQSFGNVRWQVGLLKMNLTIMLSGVFVFPIFLAHMGQKNAWVFYDTPFFLKNFLQIVLFSGLVFGSIFGLMYATEMVENKSTNLFLSGLVIGAFMTKMFAKK